MCAAQAFFWWLLTSLSVLWTGRVRRMKEAYHVAGSTPGVTTCSSCPWSPDWRAEWSSALSPQMAKCQGFLHQNIVLTTAQHVRCKWQCCSFSSASHHGQYHKGWFTYITQSCFLYFSAPQLSPVIFLTFRLSPRGLWFLICHENSSDISEWLCHQIQKHFFIIFLLTPRPPHPKKSLFALFES